MVSQRLINRLSGLSSIFLPPFIWRKLQVGEGVPTRRTMYLVLGDRRLTDLETELEQLTVDAGRTPEWVGSVHLPDQGTNFADLPMAIQTLSASTSRAGSLDGAAEPRWPASPAPSRRGDAATTGRAISTGVDRWRRVEDGRGARDAGLPVGSGAR
jgi:hypothetical protein